MAGFVGKRILNMIIRESMRVGVFQICGFSMKIFFCRSETHFKWGCSLKRSLRKYSFLAILGRSRLQVYQQGGKLSELSAEFDREPEKEFNYRDEADSEAESTNPTKAWDKVKPRHLSRSLKLCGKDNWKRKIFCAYRINLNSQCMWKPC